jgi:hypothetical protein
MCGYVYKMNKWYRVVLCRKLMVMLLSASAIRYVLTDLAIGLCFETVVSDHPLHIFFILDLFLSLHIYASAYIW